MTKLDMVRSDAGPFHTILRDRNPCNFFQVVPILCFAVRYDAALDRCVVDMSTICGILVTDNDEDDDAGDAVLLLDNIDGCRPSSLASSNHKNRRISFHR